MRILPSLAFMLATLALPAMAASDLSQEPPGGDYVQIPKTLKFPEFPPALGTLYMVKNAGPTGPYLCYHDKKLVATVYMISEKDMSEKKVFENLPSSSAPVEHVDFYYHGGHPYMEKAHYNIALWHISQADEERLQAAAVVKTPTK